MNNTTRPPTSAAARLCGISAALGVLVAASWLAETLVGEKHWTAMLLTHTTHLPLLLPLAVLLLLSLVLRDLPAAALNAATAFLLLSMLGFTFNLPRSSSSDIRLMTFNIQAEAEGLADVLQAIRDESPDVICLQEACTPPDFDHPSDSLLAGLEGYNVTTAGQIVIASRFPLVESHPQPLPLASRLRPALVATVSVRSRPIRFIAVHLNPLTWDSRFRRRSVFSPAQMSRASRERLAQVNAAMDLAASGASPVVLCGDLNMPPRGFLYRQLSGSFTDAFAETGIGFGHTISSRFPHNRIDFVWTRGLEPVSCRAIPVLASDHRPVVAEIALP